MSFPVLIQRNQMDCGPTCLAMVSKFYGRSLSMERFRGHAGYGKEGVNLLGISQAAEQAGFHSTGAELSCKEFEESVKLPAILHWHQNHFVVLYKASPPSPLRGRGVQTFTIADPAKGIIQLNKKEFLQAWAGSTKDDATGLRTSYNKQVQFREGLIATAEIVTKDMRLLQRIYYSLGKQLN